MLRIASIICFAAMLLASAANTQTTNIGGSQGINSPATSSGGSGCNSGSITSLLKGNGSGGCSAAAAGNDFAPPSPSGFSLLKANNAGGFQAATPAVDYAPATTGSAILKANGAGGFTNAIASTDYAPATSGNSLLKGNSSGGFANAVSGSDFAPATPGTSLLKGNGTGGFALAVAKTDYAPAAPGSANVPLFSDGAGGFVAGSRTGNTTQVVTQTGSIASGDIAIGDGLGNLKDGGAPSGSTQINLCTIGGTNGGSSQCYQYISGLNKKTICTLSNYLNTGPTPQTCSFTANGGQAFTSFGGVTSNVSPFPATLASSGNLPTGINHPINMQAAETGTVIVEGQ